MEGRPQLPRPAATPGYSHGLGGLSAEPAGAGDRRIAFEDTRWDNRMVALGDDAAD